MSIDTLVRTSIVPNIISSTSVFKGVHTGFQSVYLLNSPVIGNGDSSIEPREMSSKLTRNSEIEKLSLSCKNNSQMHIL